MPYPYKLSDIKTELQQNFILLLYSLCPSDSFLHRTTLFELESLDIKKDSILEELQKSSNSVGCSKAELKEKADKLYKARIRKLEEDYGFARKKPDKEITNETKEKIEKTASEVNKPEISHLIEKYKKKMEGK